jgi:hypothetical protein
VVKNQERDPVSQACYAALLDLMGALGDYLEAVVVVGGWVPELLFPDAARPPVMTTDIDLALNLDKVRAIGQHAPSLGQLLRERGYRPARRMPFRYEKDATVAGRSVTIRLDLLTSGSEQETADGVAKPVQDVQASVMRGFDLVFRSHVEVPQSRLIAGAKERKPLRVASVAAFLVMKGLALGDRSSAKDASDLHYCLENYIGGPEAVVTELLPFRDEAVVQAALRNIDRGFASPTAGGPLTVAMAEAISDPEALSMRQRAVYERVDLFLRGLGVRRVGAGGEE